MENIKLIKHFFIYILIYKICPIFFGILKLNLAFYTFIIRYFLLFLYI